MGNNQNIKVKCKTYKTICVFYCLNSIVYYYYFYITTLIFVTITSIILLVLLYYMLQVMLLWNNVFFVPTLLCLDSSLWNFFCFFLLYHWPAWSVLTISCIVFLYLTFLCCSSILLFFWTIHALWKRNIFYLAALLSLLVDAELPKHMFPPYSPHLFPHLCQGCSFIGNSAVLAQGWRQHRYLQFFKAAYSFTLRKRPSS